MMHAYQNYLTEGTLPSKVLAHRPQDLQNLFKFLPMCKNLASLSLDFTVSAVNLKYAAQYNTIMALYIMNVHTISILEAWKGYC